MNVRALDPASSVVLRVVYATPPRDGRGSFTCAPARLVMASPLPDSIAAVICAGYFASVCRMMGIDHDHALVHLARSAHGGIANSRDLDWRRAIYARQLAMYLTNTEANVPQAQLGRVTGLDRAGVHKALRAVEDLRERADYEELIRCVLVDVAMNARTAP
jgi:hypothetical protein